MHELDGFCFNDSSVQPGSKGLPGMLRATLLPLFVFFCTSPALAAWGENWGEMVWGSSAPPAAVPMTGWPGLFLLLTVLLVTALWKMNRIPRQVGLTLSVFLLVPVLIAPHISTWTGTNWYTFINGEVADANEVNGNFEALADALDVTVPNSFANSGIADANEINSNFEVLKAAVDTFTNNMDAATSATETATQNGCVAGGGTWDAGTSTCTAASTYNCFVAGFCAQAAIDYPPGVYGYTNVYEGHTQGTEPALGAGCNLFPRSIWWIRGAQAAAESRGWPTRHRLGIVPRFWPGGMCQ